MAHLDASFWDQQDLISEVENKELEKPFSLEEIHRAVLESEATGAPGPDGFSFKFYQFFWDLVKFDLWSLCQKFYNCDMDLPKLNKSIICRIPKKKDTQLIQKFRPISLVNCSLKIISKILTYRLFSIMNRIIDVNQSAFIKGRYILDNVVLSNEIIHHCTITKQQGVAKFTLKKHMTRLVGPIS